VSTKDHAYAWHPYESIEQTSTSRPLARFYFEPLDADSEELLTELSAPDGSVTHAESWA
jgi:hypothetical protein